MSLSQKLTWKKKRSSAATRYELAKTVPGTRGFHSFCPQNDEYLTLHCKRISKDDSNALLHSFIRKKGRKAKVPDKVVVSSGMCVLCQYDQSLWVGVVQTVSKEEGDCEVKFLHPQFPACSYYWPCNDDKCCIPLDKVLSQVSWTSLHG